MPSSGNLLRTLLAATSPVLHQSLERSWTIAREQWLPALGTKMGSSNAESHLGNVERYVDSLLAGNSSANDPRLRVALDPVEVYALLASVLFHDLGNGAKAGSNDSDHGDTTRRILTDGNNYAVLGIPSLEMARCIGRIAAKHSSRRFDTWGLRTGVVDPFGVVDEGRLAAILFVGDRMDSAYSRSLPTYISDDKSIEIVGALSPFRARCPHRPVWRLYRDRARRLFFQQRPIGIAKRPNMDRVTN